MAWRAWLFHLLCMFAELLFISLTTAFVLVRIPSGATRMIVAILVATPFYAYLEMAAFALFLVVFENSPLIIEEYKPRDRSQDL
jgi:hypothetical protein